MKVLKIIGLVAVILFVVVFLVAKLNRITPLNLLDKEGYNSYSGIAIQGYDPVSYFVEGPKQGNEQYSMKWKNATWLFDSQENLNLFQTNPDRYAPQFGGYCSFAVTTGFTATIDPTSYTIHEDKLYLFNGEDLKINFMMDMDQSISTATEQWEK